MWLLLACTPEPAAPGPRFVEPEPPGFSLAGCVDNWEWESGAFGATLHLDADRKRAVEEVDSAGTLSLLTDWEGACAVHQVQDTTNGYWGYPLSITTTYTRRCDDLGNPIERVSDEVQVDPWGSYGWFFRYATTYVYEGGLVMEAEERTFDEHGNFVQGPDVTTYAYDEEGQLIEAVTAYASWGVATFTYTWSGGLLTSDEWRHDRTTIRNEYAYDALGRTVAHHYRYRYNETGSDTWNRFAYDDDTPRVSLTEESVDEWATVSDVARTTWTCPP